MSSQQQNLSDIEKARLEYADFLAQNNDEEFSIREFVFKAREDHIEECWPFSPKYLRMCLDNGISTADVLHPMVGCGSPVEAGNILGSQLDDAGKASKPGVDLLTEASTASLSGKLDRLSLHDEETSSTKVDAWFQSDQSFKCKNGRKRKATKTRSLAEILCLAEPDVLIKKHRRHDDSVTGREMNSGENEQKQEDAI